MSEIEGRGDRESDELDPDLRDLLRRLRRLPEVDPAAKARLLEAIRRDRVVTGASGTARDGAVPPASRRPTRPRAWGALAAAAVLLLALAVTLRPGATSSDRPMLQPVPGEGRSAAVQQTAGFAREAAAGARSRGGARIHRFELDGGGPARGASRVSLVGDFNAWEAGRTPMHYDSAAGRWFADVLLPPGRYAYAFLADDTVWTVDPRAPRSPRDEFGVQRSVLVLDSLRY